MSRSCNSSFASFFRGLVCIPSSVPSNLELTHKSNDQLDRLVPSSEPPKTDGQLEQPQAAPPMSSEQLDRLVLSPEPQNTLINKESEQGAESDELTSTVESDEGADLKPNLTLYEDESIGVGDILAPIIAALFYIYCVSLMQ